MNEIEFRKKMLKLGYSDSEINEKINDRLDAEKKGINIPWEIDLVPKEPPIDD